MKKIHTIHVNSQAYTLSDPEAITFAPQDLSPEQQAQAKENMGITGDVAAQKIPVAFRAGTISGTNGAHTDTSPKRGRSDFINAADVLRVEADSDYKIYVHCYDAAMAYCGNTKGAGFGDGWVQEVALSDLRAKYAALSYVRISLKRNDNTNFSTTLGDAYGKVHLVKRKASQIPLESFGLPCVYLMGDMSAMSKDNAVAMNVKYFDNYTPARDATALNEYTGQCTVKWQGNSSVRSGYPKRNYTVKLEEAVTFIESWGAQKKYCLKANWIDPSAMRNILCARKWATCVSHRIRNISNPGDYETVPLYNAPNKGAVDGFPIILYINGEFAGLYTFNIPKDGWTFNMGAGSAEYVVGAESNSCSACGFLSTPTFTGDEGQQTLDFSVEYAPEGVEDSAVITSFQTMADAIKNAPNSGDWEAAVAPYLDISSAIDYMILVCCVGAYDNTRKNILYGTYDGTKWFLSAYDMDATFGMGVYGNSIYTVNNDRNCFASIARSAWNRLFYLIYMYSRQKLVDRYKVMRGGPLSDEKMWETFAGFLVRIPLTAYHADAIRWPTMQSTAVANMHTYMDYYRLHCAYLDGEIAQLEATLTAQAQ